MWWLRNFLCELWRSSARINYIFYFSVNYLKNGVLTDDAIISSDNLECLGDVVEELGRMCKAVVVPHLICQSVTIFSHDSQVLGQDLNPGPFSEEAGVLPP
jgi:hypothetical protein